MTDARSLRAPDINPETKVFWDATIEGRLLLKMCADCERSHYYPRTICPLCGSTNTHWVEANGKGSIYTFSTMRRGPFAPYALAYVTLDEGPAILTNIVDCEFDELKIGQRVEVKFAANEGGTSYPMFKPIGD